MGFNYYTKLSCTNPEIIASGSTFNQKTNSELFEIVNGEVEYITRNSHMHNEILELSKLHPNETFTLTMWCDEDLYECVQFTNEYTNGEFQVLKVEPRYIFFRRSTKDKQMNQLTDKFIEHVNRYLKRIDIIKKAPNGDTVFDIITDEEDENGFWSSFTVTWQNNEHKFTAEKNGISYITIEYEKKEAPKGIDELPF